ncbi:MAG: c-type cytochrome biogenesis protein CcsB [Candidatus Baltobacteraceae bacterium]
MQHHSLPLDGVLLIVAIGAYVVSALALAVYFFSREAWLKHFGAPLAIVGCLAQFAQLIVRFELTHIWPLLNLYGSLSLFAAVSVAIFIVFAFRYDMWFAGGIVVGLAALFLAYGATWYEGTMPAVPSLQSYWAKIHVPLVVSSYSAFMVAFALSVVYLIKYYFESSLAAAPAAAGAGGATLGVRFDTPNIAAAAGGGNRTALWLNTLPSLAQLDILIYRVVAVGLPLLTLGVITGAMWAHEAWGAYWQWDPKETAALFSWIVYAIYMHLHTRKEFRGVNSAWIAAAGFLSIMFCYFGVNLWISGLHSYKM